jgi:hypothetical protein
MKAGNLLFIAIVVGYLAFEVYVVGRNSYRTEPAYIFGEYVKAARAVESCGPLKAVDSSRFDNNYRYSKRKAVLAFIEGENAMEEAAALQTVTEQEATGRREVDALVGELGCDDIELFKLRKRYENLTRPNLPLDDAPGDR